jgi:hypothetical protein
MHNFRNRMDQIAPTSEMLSAAASRHITCISSSEFGVANRVWYPARIAPKRSSRLRKNERFSVDYIVG